MSRGLRRRVLFGGFGADNGFLSLAGFFLFFGLLFRLFLDARELAKEFYAVFRRAALAAELRLEKIGRASWRVRG